MSGHIVTYDENSSGSKSRAKCSCGAAGPWHNGGAERTLSKLDQWSENHIEDETSCGS